MQDYLRNDVEKKRKKKKKRTIDQAVDQPGVPTVNRRKHSELKASSARSETDQHAKPLPKTHFSWKNVIHNVTSNKRKQTGRSSSLVVKALDD